jgi:hypothetical protein
MLFVGLDKDGNQHCVGCGGQAFTNERTSRVTEVLGVRATLTKPVLRCVNCGEYNAVGSALEYS